jgi:hypothetical protein
MEGVLMIAFVKLELKYRLEPPAGFREFTTKHGVSKPNTCAVRLSYALFECDKSFFKGIRARSGTEWYGLPTRADDMAIILNKKIRPASRVDKIDELSGKTGIIFFDKITGWPGGSGHISLWNGSKFFAEDDDYFGRSPRVYFWMVA